MKINNITAYQNPRQNFKGAYVLNGFDGDIVIAVGLIADKCDDEYNRTEHPDWHLYPGFNDFYTRYLHETYNDDTQPNVYKIIFTNEHIKNVKIWREKYGYQPRPPVIINATGPKGCVMDPIAGPRPETFVDVVHGIMKEIHEKIYAPYIRAKEAFERGIKEPWYNLLIDLDQDAKRTLQQYIDCAVVPMEDVKVLDAKEVIKAIRNNKFNFITGVIKK